MITRLPSVIILELHLTNRQFAFARDLDNVRVIVTVNNDDNDAWLNLPAGNAAEYVGTLTREKVAVENGHINVCVHANSGEIWVPAGDLAEEPVKVDPNKAPEDMTVEELHAAILAKMANNGPVTDQMKKTVYDNIWHDSLVNWLKSFR